MNISFTVKGNPQALKRHRTVRRGKFIGQYDPSQDDKADFLSLAHKFAPEKPIDLPIKLRVVCVFQRPKNHYRTNGEVKHQFQDQPHTKKPDADNLVKFIMDSLNGVFWRDDCLIYAVEAVKQYGDVPLTEVTINWETIYDV